MRTSRGCSNCWCKPERPVAAGATTSVRFRKSLWSSADQSRGRAAAKIAGDKTL